MFYRWSRNVFRVHPCCGADQNATPPCGCTASQRMWLADERALHAHDRPRLRGRQRHAGHGEGPCRRDPGRGATSRTVVERLSFPVRDPSFLSLCRLCPSLRSRHWGSGWGTRANRGPPSSGVAFISLPSISAATFPNYVSKSVFLAMQSHQRVRRGLVDGDSHTCQVREPLSAASDDIPRSPIC